MIKFVLGVLLGFLFSKEIENPFLILEKIGTNKFHPPPSNDSMIHLDNKVREYMYTIIGGIL